MTTDCYYGEPICEGETWECETCGSEYCQIHYHQTELGDGVECVACERERLAPHRAQQENIA